MALLLSMDIGSNSIKLAEGNHGKNGIIVERTAIIPTPDDCIDDEHIINGRILADAVQKTLKEGNFKAKEAVITINAHNAVVREISLPKGKPKEIAAMVKNEMTHTYHVPETDIIQFKFMGTKTDENGEVKDLYQVAALEDTFVDAYHEIIKQLKFKRAQMDININAFDKLFSRCDTVNGNMIGQKACLFIDFGADYTICNVRSDAKQKLFRHLNIGSGEIENILSDEMLTAPADMLARKEGGTNLFTSNEQHFEILKPYFYNLLEELRKIIRFYYNRNEGDRGIDEIYIYGGGSNLAGLAGYIEENLNIKTEQITSVNNVAGTFLSKNLPVLLNAFGALIRN